MSLILTGCNVTYYSSLPSSPLKIAQSDEPQPDVMPKFNGGDPKTEFPKWTYEHLDYPEEANDARASGTAPLSLFHNGRVFYDPRLPQSGFRTDSLAYK